MIHILHAQETPCVYLLHFVDRVGTARHYIGFANAGNLERRLNQHGLGLGARVTRLAAERGVRMYVARLWQDGSPDLERRLKRNGHYDKLCPICSAQLDEPWICVEFPRLPARVKSDPRWTPSAW